MVSDVITANARPEPAVTIEDLRIETLDEWVGASASGWGISGADAVAQLRSDVERQLRDEHDRLRLVLARCDGVPAGAGAVRYVRGGGYLIGCSVVPQFRRRGVYRSLVGYRLSLLRERGIPRVFTSAMVDTSAPICARLGFRAVSRMTIYTSPSPARSSSAD